MKEAMFYSRLDEKRVRCFLCAHQCTVSENRRGKCGVRENRGGVLYSLVYGKVVALNIDPVEKKPFFHFYPGSSSLSVATAGCNFSCRHCQNFEISQFHGSAAQIPGDVMSPEDVVELAVRHGCRSISYTYTEPTIFFEFALDCARLAHERGIRNLFVSNGYTGPEASSAIAPYLDGNEVDLKGNDEFYRNVCGARQQPVLDTIRLMKEMGVWVEVTTLLIPDYNDDADTIDSIIDFLISVDASIPWHISQFYPVYRLTDKGRTPVATLVRARERALEKGLRYVYTGNVPGENGENTFCPACGEMIIERKGYRIISNRLESCGCPVCAEQITGVW